MKLIIVLLLIAGSAHAQAVSFLGMCNASFDCDKMMQTWRNRPEIVTGWLEGSFGAKCACADRVMGSLKRKAVRVHLSNGPCLRNRRCGPHEVFSGYSVASAQRALKTNPWRILRRLERNLKRSELRLAGAKGEVECYVSPTLESDFDGSTRRVLLEFVRERSRCHVIDNPLKRRCLPGYICEKHGANPRLSQPCIADLDGEDGQLVDLSAYREATKDCSIRFYWEPWMNCLRGGKFIDPRERDCSFSMKRFFEARSQCRSL